MVRQEEKGAALSPAEKLRKKQIVALTQRSSDDATGKLNRDTAMADYNETADTMTVYKPISDNNLV